MKSLIFALALLCAPGSNDEPLAVPPSYTLEAVRAAEDYADVSPAEVLGLLVMEHRGRPPYDHTSVGAAGELGLMQVSPFWARRYAAHVGEAVDLLDPHENIRAGAWVVHKMKASHTRPRCAGASHEWLAHYRCSHAGREACYVGDRADTIARLERVWGSVGLMTEAIEALGGEQ